MEALVFLLCLLVGVVFGHVIYLVIELVNRPKPIQSAEPRELTIDELECDLQIGEHVDCSGWCKVRKHPFGVPFFLDPEIILTSEQVRDDTWLKVGDNPPVRDDPDLEQRYDA